MSRTMLAALTLLAAAACARGEKRDVASADSLSRDLQLAPVDTTAALNDRPSADTAAAVPVTPAPRRELPLRAQHQHRRLALRVPVRVGAMASTTSPHRFSIRRCPR